MGADAFHVCYGLRWDVDAHNESEITLLERRQDPRGVAAARNGLECWWGITTYESRCFLLIGKLIGNYGWEGEHNTRLGEPEIVRLMEETRLKLSEAGFTDEPAWHFQFEPDR